LHIEPLTLAALGVAIALGSFLFGPAVLLRLSRAARAGLQARSSRRQELLRYLRESVMFLDGLPLFISETWAWGPSVPNYSAGGRLPNPSAAVVEHAGEVRATIAEAMQLYVTHSQLQGLSASSQEEALATVSAIQRRFWNALAPFTQSEWPLRWRFITRELRRVRLPAAERERILALKASRV
jgi:hypothetical protein